MKFIYKIYSPNSNNIYVGKCGNELNARLCQHRYYFQQFIKKLDNRFYSSSWVFIDGEAKIEQIETCEDSNSSNRESYWIHQLRKEGYNVVNERDGIVNKQKMQERWIKYYYENKEKKIETAKNYYRNNKEKCKAYQKEYYQKKKAKNGLPIGQLTNSPEC